MVSPINPKVSFFSQSLRERLGTHIRQLVLYGSQARGDAHDGSDYDFLVVVDNADSQLKEKVVDSEVEFLNAFDEVSACIVCDENEWVWIKKSPLGINVGREGIAV